MAHANCGTQRSNFFHHTEKEREKEQRRWNFNYIINYIFARFLRTGRERRSRIFSGENLGTPRYCVLCITQEGKADHVSSHVPSHRNANDIMGRYEVLSRWSWYFYRYVRQRIMAMMIDIDYSSF